MIDCWKHVFFWLRLGLGLMVFNTTFNNISVILWRSILLVEEIGVPRENHQHVACHWQTLSHNVVSSTPHINRFKIHNIMGDRHYLNFSVAFQWEWICSSCILFVYICIAIEDPIIKMERVKSPLNGLILHICLSVVSQDLDFQSHIYVMVVQWVEMRGDCSCDFVVIISYIQFSQAGFHLNKISWHFHIILAYCHIVVFNIFNSY